MAAGGGHSSGFMESRGGSRPGPRTHQWDASRLCCGGAVGAPLWRQDPPLLFLGAAFVVGTAAWGSLVGRAVPVSLTGGCVCRATQRGRRGAPSLPWSGVRGSAGTSVGSGRALRACPRRALCPQLLDGLWEAGLGSCWKSFLPPWLAPGARDTGGPSRSCHLCPWSTCLGRTAWFGSQLGAHTCKQGSRRLQGIRGLREVRKGLGHTGFSGPPSSG